MSVLEALPKSALEHTSPGNDVTDNGQVKNNNYNKTLGVFRMECDHGMHLSLMYYALK